MTFSIPQYNVFWFVGPTKAILNMASGQQHCFVCGLETKYTCILCAVIVCNRPDCSVPEENDERDGWIANKSVAYCLDCNFRPGETTKSVEDEDETGEEVEHDSKGEKKNAGRRSLWTSEHLDDMVDIITNSENFKRKLIFTNNKRATNSEIYKHVLEKIMERHLLFPFNLSQIRNKFKWCISTCKKVALTIQTVTGIKRFVEDKGFGKWFDALFPLIKSRDSCQPEQAIEPSSSTSVRSTPEEENAEKATDQTEEGTRAMFVPIKKRKRKDNESEAAAKILKVLETMMENDPTKELLQFMKEDAEKSRQNELELINILADQSQGQTGPYTQGYVPQQTWQQQEQQRTPPQHWATVPQTPPHGRYPDNHGASSSPTFHQPMNTYQKL